MADQICSLFMAVIYLARSRAAERLDLRPGLWTTSTDQWDVALNAHRHEVDGIPPLTARLTHRQFMMIAVANPAGGMVAGGASEDDLIEHLRAAANVPQPIHPAPIQGDSPSRTVPRPVRSESVRTP